MHTKHQSFNIFLSRMLKEEKLSPQLLNELSAMKASNRMLDNSDNQMGAPTLGTGNVPISSGQSHEILGAIPDAKAQLAMKAELLELQNIKRNNDKEIDNPAPTQPSI